MNKPGIFAAMKNDTLELALYGDIGENFWTGEGITPSSVKSEIDKAGKFSHISVRINSIGGSVFDGTAIYNLLRAQNKPVAVSIDGMAASIASIIAMAGDTITMGKGALMMIHSPSSMIAGNAVELRQMADSLDVVAESMADIYAAKSGKAKDEVLAIMAAETWMSAEDAVSSGFATDIADGDPKARAAARGFPMLAKLKNVPDALKRSAEGSEGEAAPQGPPADSITVLRERFKLKHKRRA